MQIGARRVVPAAVVAAEPPGSAPDGDGDWAGADPAGPFSTSSVDEWVVIEMNVKC